MVDAARCSAELLHALHDERTAALTAELTAEHDRLRAHGESVAAEISTRPGPDHAELAGLCRALRSGNRPRRQEWSVAERLPARLSERVRHWHEHLRTWLATRVRAFAHVATTHQHEVESLRGALAHDDVRRIVRTTDSALAAQATEWATDPAAVPTPTELRRLTRLLVDAAARPSGVHGTARWRNTGLDDVPGVLPQLRAIRLIDPQVIDVFAAALVRRHDLDHVVRVRLNPSALHNGGGVLQFLGERPAEPVLRVPTSPQLRSIITLLESESRTMHQLRVNWRAVTGQDARLPDLLAATGLVERFLPIRAPGAAWFDELADLLDDRHPLRPELDALRQALPPDAAAPETSHARFTALADRLNARLPQPPTADRLVADEPLAALPADLWASALPDVTVAHRS